MSKDSGDDRWKHDRWDAATAAQDGDGHDKGRYQHYRNSERPRLHTSSHGSDSARFNGDRGHARKDISFRSQVVADSREERMERRERREETNRGEKRRQGAYDGVYGEWSTKQGRLDSSSSGGRWAEGELNNTDRTRWTREDRSQPARSFLRSKDDERWQHDMFSEAVRSPSPPAESAEDKIKKIEALLAS